MKKITDLMEEVSPKLAEKYLAKNKTNRPIREAHVEGLALDMKKGHWILNHQGIAFDEMDNLIDGQHRLEAIRRAGVTVRLMVSRGWPVKASRNGAEIFTMDTVDRGKQRTIGDQLKLRHGCEHGKSTATCCSCIAFICNQSTGKTPRLTTPMALAILEIYGNEIETCIQNQSNIHGLRRGAIPASIAFAMKVEPVKAREFHDLLLSGEGIFKSGPTSPVYALRRVLQAGNTSRGGSNQLNDCTLVLNALRHFVLGEELQYMKYTSLGIEYFCNKQKSNVAKITEMLTL